MKYKIKSEKVQELKDGRSVRALAEKVGCTEEYLGQILLNNKKCSKTLAILLSLIGKNFKVETTNLEDILKYFFEEVK